MQTTAELLEKLPIIRDPNTHIFVEKALKCKVFEFKISAIVISWISTVAVLLYHVFVKYLRRFKAEAKRVDTKCKDVIAKDDISRMGEVDFLNQNTTLSIFARM